MEGTFTLVSGDRPGNLTSPHHGGLLILQRLDFDLPGGGGGVAFEPQDARGFRKWAPKSKSQCCLLLTHADGWKKNFGKKFTPVVYVRNDQRVMGIILGYVCWGTHQPPRRPLRPPPPSPKHTKGADL